MQARWAASIIHQKRESLIAQHQIRTSTGGAQPGLGLLQPGSYHGLLDTGLVQGPENFNKWALLERSSGGEVIKYFHWSSQERGSASQRRERPAPQSCWGFFTPLALLLPSHTSLAKCLHEIPAAYWVGVMQRVSPGIARICYYTVFLHRLGLVIQKNCKTAGKMPWKLPWDCCFSPFRGTK